MNSDDYSDYDQGLAKGFLLAHDVKKHFLAVMEFLEVTGWYEKEGGRDVIPQSIGEKARTLLENRKIKKSDKVVALKVIGK
jgi:hypothetical protein